MINDEVKKILTLFNELLPWDKGETLTQIVEHEMTEDEIDKYFIEGSGYTRWDDIDYVKEVMDNHLEYDVLDEMDDYDILHYLLNSSFDNSSENLQDWMERMDNDEVAEAICTMNEKHLNPILDSMIENHKEELIKIITYISKKLLEK